jgi:16S rRNA G1207 methylase RsmC
VTHYFETPTGDSGRTSTYGLRIAGREVTIDTRGGVFASRRLDPGTRHLIDHLCSDGREFLGSLAPGVIVDLGCGAGPLAVTLGILCPERSVIGVDVNERAVELTRVNARRAGLDNVSAHLVTGADKGETGMLPDDQAVAAVVSNPPVRIGKERQRAMLSAWWDRLAPDGRMLLVVSRHLGADSLAEWFGRQQAHVRREASKSGYRILRVDRA